MDLAVTEGSIGEINNVEIFTDELLPLHSVLTLVIRWRIKEDLLKPLSEEHPIPVVAIHPETNGSSSRSRRVMNVLHNIL